MGNVRTLQATAYKDGKWWMVSIPEIDALSKCKTIDQVPNQAADLAAIVLDVPKEKVAVSVTYKMPEEAAAVNESWHEAQRQLAAAREDVDAKLAELARTLKGNGYTLKDIGVLTGYTFQRISQILSHDG
jgi:hypothetical protein